MEWLKWSMQKSNLSMWVENSFIDENSLPGRTRGHNEADLELDHSSDKISIELNLLVISLNNININPNAYDESDWVSLINILFLSLSHLILMMHLKMRM